MNVATHLLRSGVAFEVIGTLLRHYIAVFSIGSGSYDHFSDASGIGVDVG